MINDPANVLGDDKKVDIIVDGKVHGSISVGAADLMVEGTCEYVEYKHFHCTVCSDYVLRSHVLYYMEYHGLKEVLVC